MISEADSASKGNSVLKINLFHQFIFRELGVRHCFNDIFYDIKCGCGIDLRLLSVFLDIALDRFSRERFRDLPEARAVALQTTELSEHLRSSPVISRSMRSPTASALSTRHLQHTVAGFACLGHFTFCRESPVNEIIPVRLDKVTGHGADKPGQILVLRGRALK